MRIERQHNKHRPLSRPAFRGNHDADGQRIIQTDDTDNCQLCTEIFRANNHTRDRISNLMQRTKDPSMATEIYQLVRGLFTELATFKNDNFVIIPDKIPNEVKIEVAKFAKSLTNSLSNKNTIPDLSHPDLPQNLRSEGPRTVAEAELLGSLRSDFGRYSQTISIRQAESYRISPGAVITGIAPLTLSGLPELDNDDDDDANN